MTLFDRITEGEREKELLEKLRKGLVTPDNLDEHCLPFFVKVQIQTTSHCNGRCTTCPYPQTRTLLPQGEMEEETFFRIVEQIKGRGVERTSLFLMNEPLIDGRLESFTRRLKAEVPETNALIFTNGLLLTEERALALADAGLDEIDVSVNGFDKESHNRVMQGIDFDKVMKNLKALGGLVRKGRLENMRVKIVGLSLPGVPEGANRFREETGLDVYLKPVTNRAGSIDTQSFGEGPEKSSSMTICQRPFVKAYLLFNGDMVLCNCDWMRTCIIGNVRENTLEELWKGRSLRKIRCAHLEGDLGEGLPCGSCDYPYLI